MTGFNMKCKKIDLEKWKDVVDYESFYKVSNYGLVKRFGGNIKSPYIDKYGYLVVSLCKFGITKAKKVHRLVAQSFIQNPDHKLEVNHKNGKKKDNNVNNLEWCTHQENKDHAYKNGLYNNCIGEKHYKSKLNKEQVKEIRGKYIPYKYSTIKLSKEYGVSCSAIQSIIQNISWKHLL